MGVHPEYFYREIITTDDSAEADEEAVPMRYEPYPGLKVVLPQMKKMPHPAYDGEEQRAWYKYVTDHDGEKEDELDMESLEESVERLHELFRKEVAELGGSAGRLLLAGSSQGCATALHAAMSYPEALGGIMASQGHLLTCTKIPSDWATRGTPVLVFNGLADSTMPWTAWVSSTYDRLRDSDSVVFFHTEGGIDHCDEEAEARWTRSFLD